MLAQRLGIDYPRIEGNLQHVCVDLAEVHLDHTVTPLNVTLDVGAVRARKIGRYVKHDVRDVHDDPPVVLAFDCAHVCGCGGYSCNLRRIRSYSSLLISPLA